MSFDITTLGAPLSLGQPNLLRAVAIRADIGPAVEFQTTQGTTRAIFPITGGEALGHGWRARILPGGADFALALPSGDYAIEARYCLEMEDGTPVNPTAPFTAEPAPRSRFLRDIMPPWERRSISARPSPRLMTSITSLSNSGRHPFKSG